MEKQQQRRLYLCFAFLVLTFAVAHGLQRLNGALENESGAYADEAAHYVTCLMVSDFMRSGRWSSPMKFAEDYYLQYPKVAIGHWGPTFYGMAAIWSLAFGVTRTSILCMLAATTALVALSAFRIAVVRWGLLIALTVALAFIANPLAQRQYMTVMTEMVSVAAFMFATNSFAAYIRQRRITDSLSFGLFASAAILVKGNGFILALLPPIAVMLLGEWRVFGNWRTYLSAAVVVVLCLPWYLLTLSFQQDGLERFELSYVLSATQFYSMALFRLSGIPVLALAGLGGYLILRNRKEKDEALVSHLALIFSVMGFHYVVPCGRDVRHLLVALPSIILMAANGLSFITGLVQQLRRPVWKFVVVGGFVVSVGFDPGFATALSHWRGFKTIADATQKQQVIFVSGDERAEGMLIEQVAIRDTQRTRYVVRGSKLLATSRWGGEEYESKYSNTAQVLELLKSIPVDLVVVDTSHRDKLPDQLLVREMLRRHAKEFHLVKTSPIVRDGRVYKNGIHVFAVRNWERADKKGIRKRLKKLFGERLSKSGG